MNYGYPYSNKVRITSAKRGSDAGMLGTIVAFNSVEDPEEKNLYDESSIINSLMSSQYNDENYDN